MVRRLRQEQRLLLVPGAVATRLGAPAPRGRRAEDLYVAASTAEVHRVRRSRGVRPFLGSGGKLAMLTFQVGIDGHWEVTAEAVRRLRTSRETGFEGLGEEAVKVMQDAAQDPDFYEWGNPSAHAQAGNDPNTGRAQPGPWQQHWIDWTRERFGRAIAAARAGRGDEALFWVGYALHAVQDLAAHRGRTNAEHSYNHHAEDHNPDEDTEAIEHAKHLAVLTLRALPTAFGDAWGALESYRGPGTLSAGDKERLLGHGWDFGAGAYFAYRRLSGLFETSNFPASERIRWCEPSRCDRLLRDLLAALPADRGSSIDRR